LAFEISVKAALATHVQPISSYWQHNDAHTCYTKDPERSRGAKQPGEQDPEGRVAFSWIDKDKADQADRYKEGRD